MNLHYLKEMYNLTKTELQILVYLDEQCGNTRDLSIRKVAKDCFTSPTSIVRLAKKLNLSGYNELVYKIKESHLPTPIVNEILPSTTEIDQFCMLIEKNRKNLVVVLGEGFSSHISSYISEVLNFHSIPNITTSHTQLINNQNNQNILFIVVSHSGEEESLRKTVELARKKNNTIIAFLGNKNTAIAVAADLIFSTDSYSPFSINIAQPQLFFGRTLVIFESLISACINSKRN
ncbi:MurR/RpiR family transcriptional regulator [Enterococcus sp. AZ101]|uniref:MurR/RpiR family transcriptional regulator n=1 Tax=Enterococcus sp. AZ101 TaxID=2774742 RepID=UPI003D29594D